MADQRRRTTGRRPAAGRRTRPRRVGWGTTLLAVAAGALVAGPQLTPVLVQVTAATGSVPRSPAATATPGRTPAPAATRATARARSAQGGLAIPQPPRPQQIVVVPDAAVGTPPVYTPRPDGCGGFGTPRRTVPGVVAGAGSATLDWMADDRAEVLGYRVQAVGQRLVGGGQPAPVVQTVGRPGGCTPVRVTVTGLTPGVPYVFWLEEQVTSASTGATRLVQVGTTEAVVIG